MRGCHPLIVGLERSDGLPGRHLLAFLYRGVDMPVNGLAAVSMPYRHIALTRTALGDALDNSSARRTNGCSSRTAIVRALVQNVGVLDRMKPHAEWTGDMRLPRNGHARQRGRLVGRRAWRVSFRQATP